MENSSTSTLSPLSPTRWPAKAFFFPYSLLLALGIVAVVGVGAVLIIVSALIALHGQLPRGTAAAVSPELLTFSLVGQTVLYIPIVALIVVALPRLAKRSLADLGLRTPTPSDLVIGVGGAVAAYLAVFATSFAVRQFTHQSSQQDAIKMLHQMSGGGALLAGVTACVLAPFVEELVFRGFLFNALLRYMPFAAAAAISGALFGLTHGQINLDLFLPLTVCGVVLAAIYYRTGNLWSNMISHGLFNSVSVILVLVYHVKDA